MTAPIKNKAGRPVQRIEILGIPVDNLSEQETLRAIDLMIAEGGSHYMAVVNASKLVTATTDIELGTILASADLVTADGMSVVWASRVLGQSLRERVTGIDMFQLVTQHAAGCGLPIYFLGGVESSVKGTALYLQSLYPTLCIAGFRDGYFDRRQDADVAEEIRKSGAQILFVGMGSPAQEKWIANNLEKTGVRFALGVGGSFDHISGRVKRAPRWMQKAGLEWLHRLIQQPRRLWRRYLIGNAVFVWLTMKQLLSRGKGMP